MTAMLRFCLASGLFLAAIDVSNAVAACNAVEGFEYRGAKVLRIANSQAYFYTITRMAVDADGAPNAYHPDDKGIDALANAGFPKGNWKSILVADPAKPDQPFVQTGGKFAGFFVSQTTLQDRSLAVTDIQRYVDSTQVPYIVFPGAFFALKGTGNFGDVGVALSLDSDKESPFIVADAGPLDAPLGEVSIRLAENLGGVNVNPRNGAGMPKGRFTYLVFPRTKSEPPWPVSSEQLQKRARELLGGIGGWDAVKACVSQR